MSIEVKVSCPLGHTCEKVVEGAIERCAWYTYVKGKLPQDHTQVNEWGCAIAWLPLIGVQTAQTNRGQTKAIEELHTTVAKQPPIQLFGALKGNGKDKLKLAGAARSQRLVSGGKDVQGASDVDGGAGEEL